MEHLSQYYWTPTPKINLKLLTDWDYLTSKFSLTPERWQDVLIIPSDKRAAFREPQLEQKSHYGKLSEVGVSQILDLETSSNKLLSFKTSSSNIILRISVMKTSRNQDFSH